MTFWPHKGDPYEIFRLLQGSPRIPKSHFGKKFNVNPKTGEAWYNSAIELRIVTLPIFRRKSYRNFREYFYFIRSKDPHSIYERFLDSRDIMYFSVHTGFSDFQIIAKKDLSDFLRNDYDVVFSGIRSDYYVSTPKNHKFQVAVKRIEEKLENLNKIEEFPTPLITRKEEYSEWDQLDEAIYTALANDLRKPWVKVLKESEAYKDKIMNWFRRRDDFGSTHVMYFPEGESAYQLSLYMVETEYDSLLIDIFSELPASSVFYRLQNKLMICIYLPFLNSEEERFSYSYGGRFIVRKVLSILQKEELVTDCTNSIVEYYYRPG